MSRCDPLALAEEFIGKLRGLTSDAEGVLDGLPNSLEELLQCVAFGHATNSTQVIDDTDAFDFDALESRVNQIFDSVSSSTAALDQRVNTPATEALAGASAAAGLWLLAKPADTFYGLARARTSKGIESALAVEGVVQRAEQALDDFTRISEQLTGPEGEDLVRRARKLVEETCPEIAEIRAQLLAISNGVASTSDLAANLCGATSLQARLLALIASLPSDVSAAVRLLESAQQLRDEIEVLDVLTKEMNDSADVIEQFESSFDEGNYTTQTEQRIYEAVAQQFADVCEQLAALAEARRFAEMVGLEPVIRDISSITIATLRTSPAERVAQVADHDAAEPFQQWNGTLGNVQRAKPGASAMEGLFGNLPGTIVDKSNELLLNVIEIEEVFADARRLTDIYLTAGVEFLSLTQEFTDQFCTGQLRKLLFKYGYDTLESLFAKGLFKDLPEALFRASTTAGQAIDCMRGLVEGSLGLLEPLTGEQRFALDAAADTMRVLENSTHLVARLAQEIDLKAPSPAAVVSEVSDLLEMEIKGALRDAGISLPEIPGTDVAPDGFVSFVGDIVDLPEGIVKEADGFLKATTGAAIPSGYGKTAEGYLTATP